MGRKSNSLYDVAVETEVDEHIYRFNQWPHTPQEVKDFQNMIKMQYGIDLQEFGEDDITTEPFLEMLGMVSEEGDDILVG